MAERDRQDKAIAALQKQLREQESELAVKSEALQRQGADLRETEAKLLWTEAALQQAQGDESEQAEDASWQERYSRLQSELEALRRRWEQRSAAEVVEKRNAILLDMLPLADHLDMALTYAKGSNSDITGSDITGDAASEAVRSFVRNIEATRDAFLETLRRYGIERIDPLGELFDPNYHEAIGQFSGDPSAIGQEGEEGAILPDHIAKVVQVGYREGERLLRPARVLVHV